MVKSVYSELYEQVQQGTPLAKRLEYDDWDIILEDNVFWVERQEHAKNISDKTWKQLKQMMRDNYNATYLYERGEVK